MELHAFWSTQTQALTSTPQDEVSCWCYLSCLLYAGQQHPPHLPHVSVTIRMMLLTLPSFYHHHFCCLCELYTFHSVFSIHPPYLSLHFSHYSHKPINLVAVISRMPCRFFSPTHPNKTFHSLIVKNGYIMV